MVSGDFLSPLFFVGCMVVLGAWCSQQHHHRGFVFRWRAAATVAHTQSKSRQPCWARVSCFVHSRRVWVTLLLAFCVVPAPKRSQDQDSDSRLYRVQQEQSSGLPRRVGSKYHFDRQLRMLCGARARGRWTECPTALSAVRFAYCCGLGYPRCIGCTGDINCARWSGLTVRRNGAESKRQPRAEAWLYA